MLRGFSASWSWLCCCLIASLSSSCLSKPELLQPQNSSMWEYAALVGVLKPETTLSSLRIGVIIKTRLKNPSERHNNLSRVICGGKQKGLVLFAWLMPTVPRSLLFLILLSGFERNAYFWCCACLFFPQM